MGFLTGVTMTEALGISVMGIAIVFVMLVLLMGVIGILSRVVTGSGSKAEQAPTPAGAPAAKQPVPAPGSCGDIKLYNVSPRKAAMVMAIVADELQVPLNTLRFTSIKEIEGGDQQ